MYLRTASARSITFDCSFERSSRPLQLTEAGKFFYIHAKRLLGNAAEIKTMTQRVGKIERSLSIGFVATTLYGLLPRIIRQFREQQANVELFLHEMTTSEQIEALKSGRIDVGFGRLRVEDPSIRRILLREESLMVALPSSHELAKKGQKLTLRDLIDQPLLVFPKQPRPSFADQILALFYDRGLTPNKVIEVRELQIAIGLVAAGEGLTIVPGQDREHFLNSQPKSCSARRFVIRYCFLHQGYHNADRFVHHPFFSA